MLLTLALFAYWTLIGFAATTSLSADRSPLRNLLLAPVIGVAIVSIPLVILNRAGWPVRAFALPLAASLLVAAGVALWRLKRATPRRLSVRRRPAIAFVGVALLALLVTGRPMLKFGFDWVSFCNDDMANYTAGAQRFYDRGFYEMPTADDLVRGTYYPADYWFLHVGAVARAGSELLIAFVKGCTPLTPHQVFMPVILSFQLAMVWSLGGLMLRPERAWVGWSGWRLGGRRGPGAAPGSAELPSSSLDRDNDADVIDAERFAPAVTAAAAAAVSPLLNLGTLYQLISQTIGLGMICVMLSLACRPLAGIHRFDLYRHGALTSLMTAAVMILYPELAPFIGVAVGGYVVWGMVRQRVALWPALLVGGIAVTGALLLLNTYVIEAFRFLMFQVGGNASVKQDVSVALFPYFMIPKGLADLWGFLPLAMSVPEPMLSTAIVAGAALLVAAAVSGVVLGWRGEPTAIMLTVMLGVTAVMFKNRAGFPLFKLSMYVQPFLLGTVALAWVTLVRWARARARRLAPPGEAAREPILARAAWWFAPLTAAGLLALAVMHMWNESSLWDDPRRFYRAFAYPYTLYWLPVVVAAAATVAGARRGGRRRTRPPGGGGGESAAGAAPWLVASAPMLALALLGMPSQGMYLRASTGVGTTFVEIPRASDPPGINDEFLALLKEHDARAVVSDTFNIVLAKFQGTYTKGRVTSYPGNLFFRQIESIVGARGQGLEPEVMSRAMTLLRAQRGNYPKAEFNLHNPEMPDIVDLFNVRDLGLLLPPAAASDPTLVTTRPEVGPAQTLLVQAVGRQSVLNRWYYPPETTPENLRAVTVDKARDHLIFIASRLGEAYFDFTDRGLPPALYQIEDEPLFFRGGSMAAIGRYLLLQAVNPSPDARLTFAYTASYNADGENRIPPVAVVGEERQHLRALGRGSARLVSAPLKPQVIQGRTYYLIDVGVLGQRFPTARTGLMNLFGADVPLDRRIVSGFARDVSLISDEAYRAADPPSEVTRFTTGTDNAFRNPRLEYSGFYEDGWVSEDAYAKLLLPADAVALRVQGEVTPLDVADFSTEMTVLIDDRPAGKFTFGLGAFDVKVPVKPTTVTPGERRDVRLTFSRGQRLPAPDRRPVACRLRLLGFEAPPLAPSRLEKFPDDMADRDFKSTGLYRDGWLPRASSMVMSQLSDGGYLTLRGRVPKIDDARFSTEVAVSIDGVPLVRRTVGLDHFEVRVPITTKAGRHTVEVKFTNVQTLPGADGRSVGAFLESLAFEPAGG